MNELVFLEPDDLNEIPFTTSKVIAENGKGHVYIIEADDRIKIGRTNNIAKRLNALRGQSGREFKRVCHTIPCSNYCNIETVMHKLFREHRVLGEWFDISFEQASKALANHELDLSDIEEKEIDVSGMFRDYENAVDKNELNKIRDANPIFKDYLEKNGFRLYFCKRTGGVMVTDDEDVDMSLNLFVAIYKSNCM